MKTNGFNIKLRVWFYSWYWVPKMPTKYNMAITWLCFQIKDSLRIGIIMNNEELNKIEASAVAAMNKAWNVENYPETQAKRDESHDTDGKGYGRKAPDEPQETPEGLEDPMPTSDCCLAQDSMIEDVMMCPDCGEHCGGVYMEAE